LGRDFTKSVEGGVAEGLLVELGIHALHLLLDGGGVEPVLVVFLRVLGEVAGREAGGLVPFGSQSAGRCGCDIHDPDFLDR